MRKKNKKKWIHHLRILTIQEIDVIIAGAEKKCFGFSIPLYFYAGLTGILFFTLAYSSYWYSVVKEATIEAQSYQHYTLVLLNDKLKNDFKFYHEKSDEFLKRDPDFNDYIFAQQTRKNRTGTQELVDEIESLINVILWNTQTLSSTQLDGRVMVDKKATEQLFFNLESYRYQILAALSVFPDTIGHSRELENLMNNLPLNSIYVPCARIYQENASAWADKYFGNNLPINTILYLRQLQNDILLSELQFGFFYRYRKANRMPDSLSDAYAPRIDINAVKFSIGQELQIKVLMPDNIDNTTASILIDNEEYRATSDGLVSYRRKLVKTGVFKLKVEVTFSTSDGKERAYSQEFHYTVQQERINQTVKSATFGYSYPQGITRNAIKNINVYVSVKHPAGEVSDTLKKIVEVQEETIEDGETVNVKTETIVFYKYLTVELIDPDSIFRKTQIHTNNRQLIDTIAGNRWRWSISTNSGRPQGMLILKISAEKPDEMLQDRNIFIDINVDSSSVFRRVWIFILEHPESLLSLILLPLLGYLLKRFLEKKKKLIY